MTTGTHDSVSSERPGGGPTPPQGPQGGNGDMHSAVSGEGIESEPASQARDEIAEDFSGLPASGELENPAGFDPTRAINEGMPIQIETDQLQELKPAEATEYFSPETVCGRDDRVRISPATAVPWRWICQLIITMPNGAGFRGTGWFIGPRCVMTAGHCVYSQSNGG